MMTWSKISLLTLLWTLPAVVQAEPRLDLHGDPLPDGAIARLGTMRLRQGDPINLLEFLDAKNLVTMGQEGVGHVWDAKTGREVRRFGANQKRGTIYYAVSILLSPDRRYLTAGSGADRILRIWDVQTGQEMWQLPPDAKGAVYRPLAFSGDSQSLLIESLTTTWAVYDVPTGKLKATLEADPKKVRSYYPALSHDGKWVAAKGQDAAIRLWDGASGKLVRQLGGPIEPNQALYSLSRTHFSADGKTLIAMRSTRVNQQNKNTGMALVFDLETGKEIRQVAGPKEGIRGEFIISPDGRTLAWPDAENTLRLYDVATGKELNRVGEPRLDQASNYRIQFSPDSKSLLIRGRTGIRPHARLVDVASGKELWAREMELYLTVFAPDGRTLAVAGGTSRSVQLWDAQTGKDLPGLAGGHATEITALTVAPDGQTAVTTSTDGLRRWDAATGRELLDLKGSAEAYFYLVGLDAAGRTAAFGLRSEAGVKTVQLWDLVANKPISQAELPRAGYQTLALSPDGATLAVRGTDQAIVLFDVATGKQRLILKEQIGMVNSPDGRSQVQPLAGNNRFLFLPDGTLATIWLATNITPQGTYTRHFIIHQADLRTGKSLGRFSVGQGDFYSDAFCLSADGRCLAVLARTVTGTPTYRVFLVEMASGKERAQVPLEVSSAIAMSPNGGMLALGGVDGTIRLWSVPYNAEVGRLTGHTAAIRALAFSGDGRRLVSGSADTSALVWDLAGLADKSLPPPATLDAKEMDTLWTTLASGEADKAFQAMTRFCGAPAVAVAQLRARQQPVAPVEPARLAQLVADLESEEFPTRQKAEDELGKLGELATGAVQKALDTKPPLDLRQRLDRLLERTTARLLGPEQLRGARVVEVLERLGSPEARQVLENLAKGVPEVRLTRDARAALDRLNRQALVRK